MTMASDGVTGQTDDHIMRNPGPHMIFKREDESDQNMSLFRVTKPLAVTYPELNELVQRALRAADAVSLMFGGLSRHEAASIWLLLNCSVQLPQLFSDFQNKSTQPLIKLLMCGLQKLPKFSGNLWYTISDDVAMMYPHGQVFTWQGFVKCLTGKLSSVPRDNDLKKTIFSIQTSSGRITAPFTSYTHSGDASVVILPNFYFQVTSFTRFSENTLVIHVREIAHPDQCEMVTSTSKTRTAQEIASAQDQSYWERVFQGFRPNNATRTALRIFNISHATSDVALQNTCLKCLSQMLRLECTLSERDLLVSAILRIMTQYESYSCIQSNGCAVLKVVCCNPDYLTGSSSVAHIQNVVLNAMNRHRVAKYLVARSLELFVMFSDLRQDFPEADRLTNEVLCSMKQHTDDKAVQCSGCLLLEKLSRSGEYATLIAHSAESRIIVNAIRLNRGDPFVPSIGWRLLRQMVGNNNRADVCPTSDDADKYISNVRAVLSAYGKDVAVQEEGILVLSSAVKAVNSVTLQDPVCLNLVLAAIRQHSQSRLVVKEAFVILSEMIRSPNMANVTVNEKGISWILTAMNKHFDSPFILEYGCKILRLIASGGYPGYQTDMVDPVSESCPKECEDPGVDHRLAVVEAGGLGVILSAITTHPDQTGVQRQGCLAIRTLEDITTVLEVLSTNLNDVCILKAILRTLEILTIHPLNRDIMVGSEGVENTISIMSSYANCVQIQEDGLAILCHLSETLEGALRVYRHGGLQCVSSLMDCHSDHEKILHSVCVVLANVYANPLAQLQKDTVSDLSVFEIKCFDHAYSIVKNYCDNVQLVSASCRALCVLPGHLRGRLHELSPLTETMKCHSTNVAFLEIVCQAIRRLVFINVLFTNVTLNDINTVLRTMLGHPLERGLQLQCLKTLVIATTSGFPMRKTLYNTHDLRHIITTMQRYEKDRQLLVVGLKLLGLLCTFVTGPTLFQRLSMLLQSDEKTKKERVITVDEVGILLDVLRTYISDKDVLFLGIPVLLACCGEAQPLSAGLCGDLKQFVADVDITHPSCDPEIKSILNKLVKAIH